VLRKTLIRIRKEYKADEKRFFSRVGAVAVLLLIISVLTDVFLPFHGVATILRAVIALFFSATIFIIGYGASIRLHEKKTEDEEWVPYRLRFSVSWRRKLAIMAGSVLFVLIYATGETSVYTFLSSVYIAIGVGLVTFIRPTHKETLREELEIPDIRDVKYQDYMDHVKKARERLKADKAGGKKKSKQSTKDELFDENFEG
jgi:hypothetical protein